MPRPKKFIRPERGLTVPKPDGGMLAAEGEELKLTPYWLRREADGDVKITDRAPRASRSKSEDK